jgi:hypothetical protein
MLLAMLVALLSLAPGLRAADGKGGPGNNPPNNAGGDNGKKNDPPPSNGKGNGPTKRVRGRYIVTIGGHYAGTGEAHATANGIKISARVKDPDGREYTLSARSLEVVNDRFSGTGSLSGMDVDIDGRVDPQDKRGEEVLKKGRITFTFRASNGKHARGAGDQRDPGA